MVEILFTAALTCLSALFLGQAALRLCGAQEWSWLAPPVGISIGMVICVPAIHVPGRCATVAVLLGLLSIASLLYCIRLPSQLPPPGGLLAAVGAFALALVPFIASGHGGILGTSLFNDMAVHLDITQSYISKTAQAVFPLPSDYPLGPHAMSAVLAVGTGSETQFAFSGWTLALPVILAWTALALVPRASWPKQAFVATVLGMPFLVAAYYGEGAFKEVLQADLVLAVVLLLGGYGPRLGLGRWVPTGLVVAGIISVYSVAGLPWPVVFCGLWAAVVVLRDLHREGRRKLLRKVRAALPAVGLGIAALFVVLIPQIPRVLHFITLRQGVNGTGIVATDIGNLVGPLQGWEALGVWNNPDFRFPAAPAFSAGMWAGFVLILVLLGGYWALRRGHWMLLAGAAGAMAIWAISTPSQSPYVVAKALVIASPLLLALAVLPLVERGPGRPPWWSFAPLLALVLLFKVGDSSLQALRISPVGPTEHIDELRPLRPMFHNHRTLFLGNDDFIKWELAGVPVDTLVLTSGALAPLRPQKEWAYGQPLDFDSVRARRLNNYKWFITTRDAAGSEPPPQVHLVRTTESYAVWKRVGKIAERSILHEGEMPGRVLDCDAPAGRAILGGGGVAAVRPEPVAVAAPPVFPGNSSSVEIPLTPGRWNLVLGYTSTFPMTVTVGESETVVPANLDRPGPRWPIGRVVVRDRQPTTVSFDIGDTFLTSERAAAVLSNLVATRVAPERVVPITAACGKYVDWYRSAPAGATP